jgi:outer membrane protein OmpU
MKFTTLAVAMLATTALTTTVSAADFKLGITGSARMGVQSVEGTAAVAATEGAYTAAQITALDTAVGTWASDLSAAAATSDSTAVTLLTELRADRAAAVTAFGLISGPTAAEVTSYNAAITAWDAAIDAADGTVGTDAVKDKTSAVNRVRIAFTGEGTLDNGLSFGATIRADNAIAGNAGTAGSQYVSGAFGKISMGDLDGADEIAVGDVAGVGVAGLGDNNELAYQSSAHNLGWELSTMGITAALSMDTTIQSGSNNAVGLSYSQDISGVAVNVGVGRSQIGTATQTSYGAGMTMAGITAKVAQSEDDNGTAADVEETAISISYNISALTGTVFQKDVATVGSADTSYTGFGVEYDLGGATAKIGVMNDDAKRQWIDAGISFSF